MKTITSTLRHSDRGYWVCQLSGWTTYSLLNFTALWRVFSIQPQRAIVGAIIPALFFLVATHLLRTHMKRNHWVLLPTRTLLRRIAAASVITSITVIAVGFSLSAILLQVGIDLRPPTSSSLPISLMTSLTNAEILMLLWLAIYFGVAILRQRQHVGGEEARLRAALRTAELSLLKSQLNPHFLFNALNTVRALINESPQRAELAVTQLARTLRYSLNSSRDELVTLANELDIVKDYLGIETLRLAERLTLRYDIAPTALTAHIPIMLLQILVENAVKHGISQLPQGGTLIIAARMENTVLILEVTNDRPLIKNDNIPSDRVGLANANERLRLMIGPSATLALDLSSPQTAKATVRIPQTHTQQAIAQSPITPSHAGT